MNLMMDAITAECPVFVVGSQRSGTTMLRYMLCAHPRLYIPPESNFIPRFFGHFPVTPLQTQKAIRIMEEILSYRMFFRDWQGELPDPQAFIAALPDLTPATLLNTLYTQYSSQFDARRWGDKSPIYTSHLDTLAQIFPSAQFIHIIRDGRDVALSMLKSYRGARFLYIDLAYAAHNWKQRVRHARSCASDLGPSRYIEIRYEQLVAEPEKVLSEICEYLGESYVPDMAEPHRVSQKSHHSKGIHAATLRPPSTLSSGRWRREMSNQDQRLFQAIAGDLLGQLGYETSNLGRMKPQEVTRYIQLQTKYYVIEWARRSLQSVGLFHPTSLLAHRLKPKKTNI